MDTNSVQVHSVSVARERLANIEGNQLITWTREKYGPAVSYTEATQANKFLLYIDGAGVFLHLLYSRLTISRSPVLMVQVSYTVDSIKGVIHK